MVCSLLVVSFSGFHTKESLTSDLGHLFFLVYFLKQFEKAWYYLHVHRIHQGSHLVPDFILGRFWITDSVFFFYVLCVYSDFLFFLEPAMAICACPKICLFNVGCAIYWHTIVLPIFLQSFYLCKVDSNILAYIYDWSFLHLLFFLLSLSKNFSDLLIFFLRTNFCFNSLLFFKSLLWSFPF